MLIQKNLSKSQKQLTYKLTTYHSSSSVFMMNNTPSIAKVPNQKVSRQPNCF